MDILITSAIGVVASAVSAWTSWFFARRKYNSEVDQNIIENMKQSLDFYKQLSDDNRERLKEVLKKNDALEQEVADLRKQLFSLMSSICSDLSCQMRKREFVNFTEYGDKSN